MQEGRECSKELVIVTPLLKVQQEALAFGKQEKCWGFFGEPGIGKSLAALAWLVECKALPAIILCRKDDLSTWTGEILLHTKLTYIDTGTQRKSSKRAELLKQPAQLYLVNHDGVKTPAIERVLRKKLIRGVVIDESTAIANHRSARTKKILSLFGGLDHKLILSGTPIANSLESIFSQIRFIRPEVFGTNYWRWKKSYFWPTPNGHGWVPFSNTKKRLHEKIKVCCLRKRKKDYLSLPPQKFKVLRCRLTKKQRKLYKEVRDSYEITLESGEIVEFDYVMQQFMKLLQITGGFYYHPYTKEPVRLPSGKLRALKRHLSKRHVRAHKKIVIWAAFDYEIKRIKKLVTKLGFNAVTYYKKTKDRLRSRKRFEKDPKVQIFIGQVRRGIGMNELVVSDYVIYYSRSLRLLERLQSRDRTHRKGSERHKQITYVDMLVPGTMDQRMLRLLKHSEEDASMVIDGPKAAALLAEELKTLY